VFKLTLNCAYVFHPDGHPAGYFQDFRQGIKIFWKFEGDYKPPTEAERKAYAIERQRQTEQRQAEEKARHEKAKSKAAYICSLTTPAPESHHYLTTKRIKPHGAKLGRDNTLIIPLQNSEGELVNLQFISESGEKRFLSGGLKKACFYILHGNTEKILVAEGFATGASLFEATGFLTVVAFDAGNLEPVSIEIRKLYPDCLIVICGDNDISQVGQKAAREAALAISGKFIIPATPGHDWNDALTMEVNHV
jgi:putative DNA primase/helicase